MAFTVKRYIIYSLGVAERYCSTHAVKSTTQQLSQSKQSTVDLNDVKHHSSFSKVWWLLDGPVAGLHTMNQLRVPLVKDGLIKTGGKGVNLKHPLEGFKILDVGCGGGILTEPLARIGATVTGIDMSEELIEIAEKHAGLDPTLSGRLTYLKTSIEDYVGINADVYDAVIASETIEHVLNQEFFLKCCRDSLKPGGSIFITTWNRTLASYITAILCAENLLRIIPYGTHQWKQFITPQETQRVLEKYGCRTQLLRGVNFNPISYRWSWTNSQSIYYVLHMIRNKEDDE